MPTKFVFLILPQVHLLDLAGPDQTIHEAIDFGADFILEYCGLGDAVSSSAGLDFKQQKHFSKVKLKAGDFLIVPGARVKYLLSHEFKCQQPLFDWLRKCHSENINLVSICAGALVLAHAGLLNGISCTTHFKITAQLQKLAPKATVKENILFLEENNIYTSAGIASGIDLMLHIVEKLTNGYFAHKVARELVIYYRRDGVSLQENVFLQFRNHIHEGIHKAQDYIIEHIHIKHNNHELAQIACMSDRNFTRTFKLETGITVNDFITNIRIEKLKTLIQNPDLSRKQIATQIGLESEKQVARLLKSDLAENVRYLSPD